LKAAVFASRRRSTIAQARIGAVNMLVDITERKPAERALCESEERLSTELSAMRQLQGISVELIHE
jgi:PAS domain-containing protein